jgi:hypothetical protein
LVVLIGFGVLDSDLFVLDDEEEEAVELELLGLIDLILLD